MSVPDKIKSTTIIQGQVAISQDPNEVLSTILGSCVAMCLIDPERKIGGMNHFLLPGGNNQTSLRIKYGTHLVELLINDLLKAGAVRKNLQAKLFGGAILMDSVQDIGKSNSDFALKFLKTEGIECISTSLGGRYARRVKFWPASGLAQQMIIPNVSVEETIPAHPQLNIQSAETVLF